MSRRWLVPFGTRPEIVKLAPVVAALRDVGFDVRTLATGQHADPELADTFFTDLGLVPDIRWSLPADEAARVGAILAGAYAELATGAHDALLVLGDTHTVPLFALAARRFGVPVVHLEAGLRSFNARSVEEGNRRTASALATLHLAPTDLAARMLEAEGVPSERIEVVGNPITDSLVRLGPPRRHPAERHGALLTAHRSTNVDDPERLRGIVELACRLGHDLGRVRFPVHPRTRDRLGAGGMLDELARAPGVALESPLRYRQMLDAIAEARVVVTDSGGLQEEAAWYGVPAVVLRNSTPRWEGVLAGTAALVGADTTRALDTVRAFCEPDELARVASVPCPYGDGHTGARVARYLADPDVDARLELSEPELPPDSRRTIAVR